MRLSDGLKPAGLGDCRYLGLCNSGGCSLGVAFAGDGQRLAIRDIGNLCTVQLVASESGHGVCGRLVALGGCMNRRDARHYGKSTNPNGMYVPHPNCGVMSAFVPNRRF